MEAVFASLLHPKGTCAKQWSEIFSNLYYDKKIMPVVQAEVAAHVKEPMHAEMIKIIHTKTHPVFKEAEDNIKEEVEVIYQAGLAFVCLQCLQRCTGSEEPVPQPTLAEY